MPNRRKPNHLKVLEGTDRPDRMFDEPELPTAEPEDAPDWLSGPEAVKEWDRIVELLLPVRTLSEGDLTMLGHLCNHHASIVKKWRLGASPTGTELTQLRLMYTEFGLTPASRSKAAQLGDAGDENPFADLDEKAG